MKKVNSRLAKIALPLAMTTIYRESLTDVDLTQFTGSARRLPNSVSGLSPNNPSLKIVNSARITAPYHSIIGDRGKGDSPNSTDGVVPYWSSHLDGAKSELIVPGPHGSCNLPQTIGELKRILRLRLRASAASTTASFMRPSCDRTNRRAIRAPFTRSSSA